MKPLTDSVERKERPNFFKADFQITVKLDELN